LQGLLINQLLSSSDLLTVLDSFVFYLNKLSHLSMASLKNGIFPIIANIMPSIHYVYDDTINESTIPTVFSGCLNVIGFASAHKLEKLNPNESQKVIFGSKNHIITAEIKPITINAIGITTNTSNNPVHVPWFGDICSCNIPEIEIKVPITTWIITT